MSTVQSHPNKAGGSLKAVSLPLGVLPPGVKIFPCLYLSKADNSQALLFFGLCNPKELIIATMENIHLAKTDEHYDVTEILDESRAGCLAWSNIIFGFSIKLHNGGVFTISPNRKYNNGNINFVDVIDSCDLDNGLEPLACDKDVVLLGNYVTQGPKLVEVFVEHEKTNPEIYTTPKAKRLLIEELDDAELIISKAGITPVAKKLVLDVNNKQISGKDLEGQSSAVGNDGSSQVPKGDEERHSEEETEVEDESDSEDSDYLVDEDNNVDDVDVDIEDFEYNIDEEVEFVGCRDREQHPDIKEGDAEEREVVDNDYFESALIVMMMVAD
ncbi:hypothetical protein Tco_0593168 [Tanacetum coccineum]